MSAPFKFIDLYCGGGGTSEGARQAFNELEMQSDMTGINHWDLAIKTHKENHPAARHICMSLDKINPHTMFKGIGKINFMWASPECTFHSTARGGKPINDQVRATAMCVVRFADELRPDIIQIENVPEFQKWGPCIRKRVKVKVRDKKTGLVTVRNTWGDVPDPKRKGEIFHAWINMIKAIGYRVEYRVLCAANYGDPTTRERLIIYCVRGKRKIIWPNPSHAENPEIDLFGNTLKPWVPVRECIDWSILGESIFTRKRPLLFKTMQRIITGVERFPLVPFVLGQQSGAQARPVDQPAPTVAAAGAIGLTTAALIPVEGYYRGNAPRSTDQPAPAVTSKGGGHLAQTFLVHLRGTGTVKSVDKPSNTITAGSAHLALTSAFLTHFRGQSKTADPEKPAPTITGEGHLALTTTFLMDVNHGNNPEEGDKGNKRRVASVDAPIKTVTGSKGTALCQTGIVAIDHQGGNGKQIRSTDEPLSTITTKQRHALAEAFLVPAEWDGELTPEIVEEARKQMVGFLLKYNGMEFDTDSVDVPIGTISTKSRFGLVRPVITVKGHKFYFDIFFRMLNEEELKLCQGFPKSYKFMGKKKEIVRQIGNAVPVNMARALVRAAITQAA